MQLGWDGALSSALALNTSGWPRSRHWGWLVWSALKAGKISKDWERGRTVTENRTFFKVLWKTVNVEWTYLEFILHYWLSFSKWKEKICLPPRNREGIAELYLPVGTSQPHPARGRMLPALMPTGRHCPLLPHCWVLAGQTLLLHGCLIYTNVPNSGLSFHWQFRQNPQSKEFVQQGWTLLKRAISTQSLSDGERRKKMKWKPHLFTKSLLILNSSNMYSSASIEDTTYTIYTHLFTHSHRLHGKLSVEWCLGALPSRGGM